jgi:hypothetical protein
MLRRRAKIKKRAGYLRDSPLFFLHEKELEKQLGICGEAP